MLNERQNRGKLAPFVDLRSDAGFKAVLDLVCVDKSGRTFIVEMQASPEDSFFERCVYYASGLYHLELSDGTPYKRLRPVYVISFLDYRLRHEDASLWDTDRFISYWRFIEKRTWEVANQTISVIFVEMALFTKRAEECVTESDRLFYIFRNGGGFERIPEWIEESGGVSRRLAEACEVAAFSKEKKQQYEDEKMNERDIRAQLKYAVREGRQEEKASTLASVAKAMLSIGLPLDQIMTVTGLNAEEIKALR